MDAERTCHPRGYFGRGHGLLIKSSPTKQVAPTGYTADLLQEALIAPSGSNHMVRLGAAVDGSVHYSEGLFYKKKRFSTITIYFN